MLALIDTGSSENIIREGMLERLRLVKHKLHPYTKRLSGVTGKILNTKGRLSQVPICLDPSKEIQNEVDLLVVTDVTEDLILGQQFLSLYKFNVDFNRNRLWNDYFSTKLLYGNNNIYQVVVEQDTIVHQMAIIPCKILNEKGETPQKSFYGDYWGDDSLGYASGADTVLCEVEDGTMDVCFANLCAPAEIKLPEGTTIGWISCTENSVKTVRSRKWEDNDPSRLDLIIKVLRIDENKNLDSLERNVIVNLIKEFADIFATGRDELNETDLVQHDIPLTTDRPINVPYRRIPFHLVDDCEKEINELLEAGIIEHSNSNYNSPVIILEKGEKTRLIIDFRYLNKYSQRSQAAVPALSTITVGWNGCKYFSSLDIKDGFLQIPINPAHRKYTAFAVIGLGFYQFRRMPLGLCGAPSTFQNLLDRLLAGIKTKAAAYIDDIILGAQTVEEMTTNLREVFTRIRTSKLRFNPVKCELFQTRIKYLGVYLSENGIEPDKEKIQAIQNMSVPKTKKQMMRFIGGISWFRNHIPNLSEITKPLSDTLRGKRFSMTAEAIKTVEDAKKVLTEAPILIFADQDREMILYTDASELAMGGVIGHKVNRKFFSIAYGSRILNDTEQTYVSRPSEFVAIDLIGPLSKTGYYKWILTMVCRFTKFVVAIPLRNATSEEIAKAFVNHWVLKFGVPEKVLSDRGANLIQAEVIKEIYAVLGIKKVNTTAYNPQGNGTAERMNRSLVTVLKKLVYDNPTNRAKKLACAVFAVNSNVNSSTRFTPNFLFLGRECRSPQDLVYSTTSTEYYSSQAHLASDLHYQMKDKFDLVRTNMQVSQNMQKEYYDKKANFHTNYKVGDKILVWKPISQSIIDYRKFKEVFSGPWEIVKILSPWSFLVKHETTNKEEVVHFNKMRLIPPAVIARQSQDSANKEKIDYLENRAPQQTQRNDSQDMSMQFPCFERPAHGFHAGIGNSSQYGNRQQPYNLRQTIRKPARYQ